MTHSAVGSTDGERRRDLRDRIGLAVGAGLAITALLGSVMVMLNGATRHVLDAAAGVVGHASSRPPTSAASPPGGDLFALEDEPAAPEVLARAPDGAPTMTISMVSVPVPVPVPVPGPTAGATTAPEGTDAARAGDGGSDDDVGFGTVEVGTTPGKGSPAPTVPPPPAPTEAPPPATAPPVTAPPPTAPPPTAPPPTAPPTTVASGPQLSSSLACQPTAANLRLDMFTGNGGEIRRVRITGFNTPGCSGAQFTIKFLDGNGGHLMSSSGTLKAPGPVSQTVYLDVAGLGGHNVKPSKVKKVDVKP